MNGFIDGRPVEPCKGNVSKGDNYLWLDNNQVCKAEGGIDIINNHIKHGHCVKLRFTDGKIN